MAKARQTHQENELNAQQDQLSGTDSDSHTAEGPEVNSEE